MKKIVNVLILLLVQVYLFSGEIVKFLEIKSVINDILNDEKNQINEKIKNKKLVKEKGWILYKKTFDATQDIVYVDMDRPSKNFESNKPDLFFIISNKISRRLDEYQSIYFNAIIKDFDSPSGLIEITDVYLSGIMR